MLNILLIMLLIFSTFYWATFGNTEGRDERGKIILGKASQPAFLIFALGIAIILSVNKKIEFSNGQFTTAVIILFCCTSFINSLAIAYYRRRI